MISAFDNKFGRALACLIVLISMVCSIPAADHTAIKDELSRRLTPLGQPFSYQIDHQGCLSLDLRDTSIEDLTPLVGLPIKNLVLIDCPVRDLSPLRDIPLKSLWLRGTHINTLAPLVSTPLEMLDLPPIAQVSDLETINSMRALQIVSTSDGHIWSAGQSIRLLQRQADRSSLQVDLLEGPRVLQVDETLIGQNVGDLFDSARIDHVIVSEHYGVVDLPVLLDTVASLPKSLATLTHGPDPSRNRKPDAFVYLLLSDGRTLGFSLGTAIGSVRSPRGSAYFRITHHSNTNAPIPSVVTVSDFSRSASPHPAWRGKSVRTVFGESRILRMLCLSSSRAGRVDELKNEVLALHRNRALLQMDTESDHVADMKRDASSLDLTAFLLTGDGNIFRISLGQTYCLIESPDGRAYYHRGEQTGR